MAGMMDTFFSRTKECQKISQRMKEERGRIIDMFCSKSGIDCPGSNIQNNHLYEWGDASS